MAGPKFINQKCPMCGNEVYYPPGYDPKTAKDHGNVEWLMTKRGLKQFFHTDCYIHMVKDHGYWIN